jgi:hypothetical protein
MDNLIRPAPTIRCNGKVCPENACLRNICEGQYAVSFEQLQDIFDGGEETAGMGRSQGIQFYLAQIAKEHRFFKEHGNHAEG